MHVLITGAGGFVGPHLRRALEAKGHRVTGAGLSGGAREELVVDVTDQAAVSRALDETKADAVAHLAGFSSVSECAKHPKRALEINVGGTLAVCQAIVARKAACRLLLVSSGEVYGAAAGPSPLSEAAPVDPMNVYGATKRAAEVVALQHRHLGLDVVIARPFNHIGAGQTPTFVLPSFAQQLSKVPRGAEVTLEVGNLSAVRDFSHVDDIVEAYVVLLERGAKGEIYNLGSGQGRSIESMLQALIGVSGRNVKVVVDPARLRPVEIPVLVGDATKARALGWAPSRTPDEALLEVLSAAGG